MVRKNKNLLAKTKKSRKRPAPIPDSENQVKTKDVIKTGGIDALVVSDKINLKVYTEALAADPYRVLIENMHEGAVAVSDGGMIVYCNSYFASMVNRPLQTVIGARFVFFVSSASKSTFEVLLKRSGKHSVKEEIELDTDIDKSIPVLMSINSLSLNNSILSFIVLTDLTAQRNNQEELKQRAIQLEQKNIALEIANRELTSFTRISSHDLQEPLRKIQTFVSCLLDEEQENLSSDGKIYLQKTHETATRMRRLIEDLLDYSRVTNNELQYEEIEFNDILQEIVNGFKESIERTRAEITIGKMCKLRVVQHQFYQIFQNLISNSLKFHNSETPPRIEIGVEVVQGATLVGKGLRFSGDGIPSDKTYCHIVYTDNGIGFEPQYKERIFEVFQRLHGQEQYKGTGIGLALVKRIVENHRGIVIATSELGKGARFDIYLPS